LELEIAPPSQPIAEEDNSDEEEPGLEEDLEEPEEPEAAAGSA
jgi:hypothetical protein